MSYTNTRERFEQVFRETVVPAIMEDVKKTAIDQKAYEWLEKAVLHNTIGGKYNRGMTVPDSLRILKCKSAEEIKDANLTEEEYKLSSILGWCTELLQAMFLVADDIMDASITRRGHPCWYRMEGVGMVAINDSFILGAVIFNVLKRFFRQESYYVDLLELFHDTSFQTELGQLLDLITAPEDKVNLKNFNLDKYSFIVRYKTAYYSFYLPVALAMYQAGVATEENLKEALTVLIPLGEYFQVQDDFLDCYGVDIGKIGTDIQDNKCGWLINKALEIVGEDSEHRKILDENYGKKDAECEKKVKAVYNELQLEQIYHDYEKAKVAELEALIKQCSPLNQEVFNKFLSKIAYRKK
ncbi:putative farnesyl-diphosphate synthetase [Pyronema omphalodes]|nr:putative farnesyl-diphosphate synthetase [Pyronema omphalodes]